MENGRLACSICGEQFETRDMYDGELIIIYMMDWMERDSI